MRKWRSLKSRILQGKVDGDVSCRNDEEQEEDEILDERCRHVVHITKDDNKCAECDKEYDMLDNDGLECPMCKQWFHNVLHYCI